MVEFLFVTDLDNTLVGDKTALQHLNEQLSTHREMHGTRIVYSTGRSHPSYCQLAVEQSLLPPDALITGVGTAIRYNAAEEPDAAWSAQLQHGWDRDRVVAVASHFADLVPQPEMEQGPFKVSFFLEESIAPDVLPSLELALTAAGLQFNLIYSGKKDLDILPINANKGLALAFLLHHWQADPARTVTCGDSGNDRALFSIHGTRGIIVGNAYPELLQWHYDNPSPERYLAKSHCAAGIVEGLSYFGFL